MEQFKMKIFRQLTGECCHEESLNSSIQHEAIEEYYRKVEEIDLPDEECYVQLFRIKNGAYIPVSGAPICAIERRKNHQPNRN